MEKAASSHICEAINITFNYIKNNFNCYLIIYYFLSINISDSLTNQLNLPSCWVVLYFIFCNVMEYKVQHLPLSCRAIKVET